MNPNLTYIVLNPTLNATLNATLYQPVQLGFDERLKEWSPILLGIAQVIAAAILAWLTYELWRSTSEYSKQVSIQTSIMIRNTELSEKDAKIKERIRRIEHLNKEMECVIGPLQSRLGDPDHFNPKAVIWHNTHVPGLTTRQKLDSEFWRDIKKNLYLTTPKTRKGINDYLDIKLGKTTFKGGENDPVYTKTLENINYEVEERHKAIIEELDSPEDIDSNNSKNETPPSDST